MRETFHAHIAAKTEFKSEDPLGDQIRTFDERIGMHKDTTDWAISQLKEFYKLQGKEWDDTVVRDEDVKGDKWWDVGNVEYTGMSSLNEKLVHGKG
jgi:hypothetical protein